jgi:hypothetical protein
VSNYVDPDATRPFDLGPCRCPHPEGTPPPHVNDSADIVVRFPYGDRSKIRLASGGMLNQVAILLGVKRWTLVLPDGSARPIDGLQVHRLDEPTVELLVSDEGLGKAMEDEELPKAPGEPSPSGSPEKPSSTRKTRTRRPSTTP